MRKIPLSALGALALLAVVAVVALAGCGTQGYAAALGQSAHTTFTGDYAGSASFTPTYATYFATYYEGHLVPYVGAKTPVELRNGDCAGPLIANLTQASDDQPATSPAPPLVRQDPTQPGVDVAVNASANLWITVRAKPNDPNADILACGQPLSGRKQTFDIYPPSVGSDGTALGFTLQTPIVATQLHLAFTHPTTSAVAWVVRSGSCGGDVVATGESPKGATQANGYIFQTLDSAHWRLILAPVASSGSANSATACYSLT
ncbi:MAG TPA: hypothetical protein VMV29_15595 [Ktedonobacterales bacterium]|nr:hypothetical protein [Ktedonobacterales bacterium]